MSKRNNRKNMKEYLTKKSTKRVESSDDDQSSDVFREFPRNSIISPENSEQESLCENLKQKLKRNIINTSHTDMSLIEWASSASVVEDLSLTTHKPLSCQQILTQKYATSMDAYNCKVVNDIIGNETTRIVAIFKDYLLQDDMNDFMRRYYTTEECKGKISNLTEYYNKYCTVFPNYINLDERRYVYKNIIRKQ
ncbi:unnamed protein product [Moneuplotes crassus]|uniref:Uncharacterized protein n=1 Tax=Euplotes crassus TaxID=5936 RepID=A0AAD1Y3N4_EUPCR|nr:unnamed protein product [Moneuplotes crassus]